MTNQQKFVLLSVREKKFEKNFCRICYLVWFQFLKERFCFLTISVENKGGSYWLILYIVPNFAKTCCFPVIIILDIKCSIFFFYQGFLSRTFTNHRTAGEGRRHFINSSLPIQPALQTLRHQPGDYCRDFTSPHS